MDHGDLSQAAQLGWALVKMQVQVKGTVQEV